MGTMAGERTFVIVGAGLTGGAAATALRDGDFDGRLVVSAPRTTRPTSARRCRRTTCGGRRRPASSSCRPPTGTPNTTSSSGPACGPNPGPAAKTVRLDGGEPIAYDRLLLATGGRNRTLTLPGSELEGIFQLRTIEDADRIREAAAAGGRVAIVGAGFIGMEVAASLRSMGRAGRGRRGVRAAVRAHARPRGGRRFPGIHRTTACLPHGRARRPVRGRRAGAARRHHRGNGRRVRRGRRRAWASSRSSTWPSPPASRSTTASWRTGGASPATPTCSPRATWRTRTTRCSAGASASSTTTTR